MTDIQLTAVKAEVLSKPTPHVRLTTVKAEALLRPTPKVTLTTAKVEVLYSIASAGSSFKRRVVTVITS